MDAEHRKRYLDDPLAMTRGDLDHLVGSILKSVKACWGGDSMLWKAWRPSSDLHVTMFALVAFCEKADLAWTVYNNRDALYDPTHGGTIIKRIYHDQTRCVIERIGETNRGIEVLSTNLQAAICHAIIGAFCRGLHVKPRSPDGAPASRDSLWVPQVAEESLREPLEFTKEMLSQSYGDTDDGTEE